MRQGGQNRTNSLGPSRRDVPDTFFRLCHHCFYLNEADQEISRCTKCETKFISNSEDENYGFETIDEDLEELAGEGNIITLRDEDDSAEGEHPVPSPKLNGLNVKW
jgi:hypothetical protein